MGLRRKIAGASLVCLCGAPGCLSLADPASDRVDAAVGGTGNVAGIGDGSFGGGGGGNGGAAGAGGCVPPFADCNGTPADGCEADLTTAANCGACGKALSATGSIPSDKLVSVQASGNKLTFTHCSSSGTNCSLAKDILLTGMTATGSVIADGLRSVQASGNKLSFTYCNTAGTNCQLTADITFTGATPSGSISADGLRGVQASGNKLTFTYCNTAGTNCSVTKDITLGCAP